MALAFKKISSKTATSVPNCPCVLFVNGFGSELLKSKKCAFMEQTIKETDRPAQLLLYDHYGHGESPGTILAGTIGQWTDDLLLMISKHTSKQQPLIFVGSSMGAWLSLLALRDSSIRARTKAFIGISSAFDFSIRLRSSLTSTQLEAAKRCGYHEEESEYFNGKVRYGWNFLYERAVPLQQLDYIKNISFPITLLASRNDKITPWQANSLVLIQSSHAHATLHLMNSGNHQMSSETDLALLQRVILNTLA
jgi:pimeloyl-ACP methyl ester carboxylesterase